MSHFPCGSCDERGGWKTEDGVMKVDFISGPIRTVEDVTTPRRHSVICFPDRGCPLVTLRMGQRREPQDSICGTGSVTLGTGTSFTTGQFLRVGASLTRTLGCLEHPLAHTLCGGGACVRSIWGCMRVPPSDDASAQSSMELFGHWPLPRVRPPRPLLGTGQQ